ncbi:hypothetical protein D3C86_1225740 [compost metagenome]
MVQQAGKAYLRNVRIKQFTLGIVVTAAATAGIVYWSQSQEDSVPAEKNNQELVVNLPENDEPVLQEDTLNVGTGHLSDNLTPLHIPDGTTVDTEQNRSRISFQSSKGKLADKELFSRLKTVPITFRVDSVPGPGTPENLAVMRNTELKDEFTEIDSEPLVDFTKLYDSVGRFNDLYCGYALVMDNSKIGFIDRKGSLFIPLIYDQIVVTSNIQSSKDKHKKKKKMKVLYIPKRSGSEVQYCDEKIDSRPASDSAR